MSTVLVVLKVKGRDLKPQIVKDEIEQAIEEINTGLALNDCNRWDFEIMTVP